MVDNTTMTGAYRYFKNGENNLNQLQVFDSLEVGPPVVEPKRITSSYRLTWAGKTESTDLTYTYEESVFDPNEPESQNLAGMILAQVALNYGLFINAIVDFLIVAFVIFLVVKGINKLQKPAPEATPTSKKCPYCFTDIALEATRCPNCTSELD